MFLWNGCLASKANKCFRFHYSSQCYRQTVKLTELELQWSFRWKENKVGTIEYDAELNSCEQTQSNTQFYRFPLEICIEINEIFAAKLYFDYNQTSFERIFMDWIKMDFHQDETTNLNVLGWNGSQVPRRWVAYYSIQEHPPQPLSCCICVTTKCFYLVFALVNFNLEF